MKKKLLLILLIITIFTITSCSNKEDNVKKTSNQEISSMKAIINEKEYIINLEDNNTVKELKNLLPLDLKMEELNGNEKYVYLDKSLTNNPTNPNKINKGDIMIFGNNCLVIFYKSFETTYSYTKIGHINNLPDLNDKTITIKIIK